MVDKEKTGLLFDPSTFHFVKLCVVCTEMLKYGKARNFNDYSVWYVPPGRNYVFHTILMVHGTVYQRLWYTSRATNRPFCIWVSKQHHDVSQTRNRF